MDEDKEKGFKGYGRIIPMVKTQGWHQLSDEAETGMQVRLVDRFETTVCQ
jgi:hypothetical protein